MSKQDSNKALHEAVEELDAAREVVRLRLHLLSMDARRGWDGLEEKVKELQHDLVQSGEKVGEASAIAARELARSVRKFVERHSLGE
jgi:hypothetical protein